MSSNTTMMNKVISTQAASNRHELMSSSDNNNTTFVQANPSNFRAIVQQLTGAPSTRPVFTKPDPVAASKPDQIAPRRSAFKLHERRESTKKLQLKLNNVVKNNINYFNCNNVRGFLVSPVSTLDFFGGGGGELLMSPTSPFPPCDAVEEEERVVSDKGFCLQRISPKPPKLLPLFPLHSPREVVD